MILKASQRSGKGLARHLLNLSDNEFVEVHEVSGFLSDDLAGAFIEIEAASKGTKCRQPFFSVSMSPPKDAKVTVEMFEEAARHIAEANGLAGQPQVLVFHEKYGRRHAHLVISRIDAETMTAKNLPHFKNKLQTISRDLFIEQGWRLPPGMRDRSLKSPTNVTLAEWQAAKRRGKNAVDQKKLVQQCLAASDSKAGFEKALADHGYILAKGNRRSHVVVCHDGEVLAVARATGLKAKEVRGRLGEADLLPSVEDAMAQHTKDVRGQFIRIAGEARQKQSQQRLVLEKQLKELIAKHQSERVALDQGQTSRWAKESVERAARFKGGIAGLWQRLSGKSQHVENRNAQEAHDALHRDRVQRQQLIEAQLQDSSAIDQKRTQLRQQAFGVIEDMRSDRDRLIEKLTEPQPIRRQRRPKRDRLNHEPVQGPSWEL